MARNWAAIPARAAHVRVAGVADAGARQAHALVVGEAAGHATVHPLHVEGPAREVERAHVLLAGCSREEDVAGHEGVDRK